MSLNKLSLARNNEIANLFTVYNESLASDIPAGYEKIANLFTVYKTQPKTLHTDRTASPLFTRLHSGEGNFFTSAALVRNTEVKGWSNDPDRHLALLLCLLDTTHERRNYKDAKP